MNLVADENVDAGIVSALRGAGHDVAYVREMDPGIDDARVLELADAGGRCSSHRTRTSASWSFAGASFIPVSSCSGSPASRWR